MKFTIVGYHGTDEAAAQKIIEDGFAYDQDSDQWFGPGAYFWENDRFQAWWWVCNSLSDARRDEPAILRARVEMTEEDLDLTTGEGRAALRKFVRGVLDDEAQRDLYRTWSEDQCAQRDDAYFLALYDTLIQRDSTVRVFVTFGSGGYRATTERLDFQEGDLKIKSRIVSNGCTVIKVRSDNSIGDISEIRVEDVHSRIKDSEWHKGE